MKKLFAVLFSVFMLLILSSTSVFAASATQDNISVTLSSDKTEYEKNDVIHVTLTVTNNNSIAVNNVSLEAFTPENYTLDKNCVSSSKIDVLESGKSATIELVYNYHAQAAVTPDKTEPDSTTTPEKDNVSAATTPDTGDTSNIYVFFVSLAISTVAIVVIIKRKKSKQFLSIILCFAMISTIIPLNIISVEAKQLSRKSIDLTEAVIVSGEKVEFKATVSYDSFEVIDTNIERGISLDTSKFSKHLNLDDKYILTTYCDEFNGTLKNSDKATSFEFKVLDIKGTIIKTGNISISENWSSTDIAFLLGTNILVLKAIYSDNSVEEVSYKIDVYTDEYKNDLNIDLTDIDGDGLENYYEDFVGSDKNKADTDGDNLDDYQEAVLLYTDPTKEDSDDNGTPDYDEDLDKDSLSNGHELNNSMTNPSDNDSDQDTLDDNDEINHQTNPNKSDTDEDGVSDSDEIRINSNPLVKETSFTEKKVVEQNSLGESQISVSAKVNANSEQVGTLKIEELDVLENSLVNPSIPGYISSGYSFSIDGSFDSAEISFDIDESLGTINEDFQPRIYYYNEENNILEELPNQTIEGRKISATITHFSTYILLNKVDFDKVWSTEIKPTDYDGETPNTGLDVVFVLDSSGSMSSNDSSKLRLSSAKEFVSKLGENDRAAVVDFDDYSTVHIPFTSDKISIISAIDNVDASGGTNLSAGMSSALRLFETTNEENRYKYIIFLTDGQGTYSSSYTTKAVDMGVEVYTIGLGDGTDEALLQTIADTTGGKYYKASTSLDLSGIYDFVVEETIDYSTDSNKDGISDYYTKLIYEGQLLLGNGSREFMGTDLNFDQNGNPSADFDGDGLLNGEELVVKNRTSSTVYVNMISDPTLVDTDADDYDDYTEVKSSHSDPLKRNVMSIFVDHVLNDDLYMITSSSEEFTSIFDGIRRGIWRLFTFDWSKKEEVTQALATAFEELISQDAVDSMTFNKEKENLMEVAYSYIKEGFDLTLLAQDGLDALKFCHRWKSAINSIKNLKYVSNTTVLTSAYDKALRVVTKHADKSTGVLSKLGDGLVIASCVINTVEDFYNINKAFSSIKSNKEYLLNKLDILKDFRNRASDSGIPASIRLSADDIIASLQSEIDAYMIQFNHALTSACENVLAFTASVLSKANPCVLAVTIATALLDLLCGTSEKINNEYKLIAYDLLSDAFKGKAMKTYVSNGNINGVNLSTYKNSEYEFKTAMYDLASFRYYADYQVSLAYPRTKTLYKSMETYQKLTKEYWYNF